MTAERLARRLTDAATRTAARRAQLAPTTSPETVVTEPTVTGPTPGGFVPVPADEVPTGWQAYGRGIWPLGDDITDDRVVVEGADRRSYAALNHYLRADGDTTGAHRGRDRDIPTITEGRVRFERAGDDVRVTTRPQQQVPAALVAVLIADR
jgi:hypothetical protein